jgi:fucose 4-O-acetylase-like acetyltransferase
VSTPNDRLDALVDATPASRDRFMDMLRAASIVTVVIGHWLISIIAWDSGTIRTTSAIGVAPGLWLATWVLQVMPIFFFVGGFANLVAYDAYRRRGASTIAFIRSRVERLMKPSLIFLGVWLVVQVVLHLTDTGAPTGPRIWGDTHLLRGMHPPGATVPFGPTWFIAVYLIVVVISPATIWLHRRIGWGAPLLFGISAIVTDLIGFGASIHGVRYANVAFVLLFPHQLGHLYASGAFARLPRAVPWAMVVSGLGALIALTTSPLFIAIGGARRFVWFPQIGHYPKSLLGTDVEAISNAYPPTVCYLAVGLLTIGGVLLLREPATRWLQGRRPWRAVIAANSVVMTLFLWHMTAFLLAVLVLWPLGFGRESEPTVRWWLERFLWVGAPGLFLAGLIVTFARFERPRPQRRA